MFHFLLYFLGGEKTFIYIYAYTWSCCPSTDEHGNQPSWNLHFADLWTKWLKKEKNPRSWNEDLGILQNMKNQIKLRRERIKRKRQKNRRLRAKPWILTGLWTDHWEASQNPQRRGTPLQPQNQGCSHLAAAEAVWTDHPRTPIFQNPKGHHQINQKTKPIIKRKTTKQTHMRFAQVSTSFSALPHETRMLHTPQIFSASEPPPCFCLCLLSTLYTHNSALLAMTQ